MVQIFTNIQSGFPLAGRRRTVCSRGSSHSSSTNTTLLVPTGSGRVFDVVRSTRVHHHDITHTSQNTLTVGSRTLRSPDGSVSPSYPHEDNTNTRLETYVQSGGCVVVPSTSPGSTTRRTNIQSPLRSVRTLRRFYFSRRGDASTKSVPLCYRPSRILLGVFACLSPAPATDAVFVVW